MHRSLKGIPANLTTAAQLSHTNTRPHIIYAPTAFMKTLALHVEKYFV